VTWARSIGSLITRPERPAVAGERALLEAVIADPDDEGARLVYADWLQGRGPLDAARGELIAVQCALRHIDDPIEHNRLKARDFELVERYGNIWCAQAGVGDVRNNWYRSAWAADFQRGFLETVEMPAAAYASVVARLFALEPVRALVLVGRHPDGALRLRESVYLRRLRSFGLRRSDLPGDALVGLVGSPMFGALERVEIEQQAIDLRTVEAIGHTGVRELSLRSAELDLVAIGALLRTPVASRLEVLVLDGNPIGNDGALLLARAPELGAMRRLSLSGLALDTTVRDQLVERFGAAVEL
jgi:uncharacterized protein (TIGR02996 family)